VRNHRNGDDFSALESSDPGQRFLKVSKAPVIDMEARLDDIQRDLEFSPTNRLAGKDRQRNWGAAKRGAEGGVGKCSRHRRGDDIDFALRYLVAI
jgi:hypothetical protein